MAKRVAGSAAIVKYHDSFHDATQREVEHMFIRGSALHEVQDALGLSPLETEKRYLQVHKYYSEAALAFGYDAARIQALCLLQQSYDRCRQIQSRIDFLNVIIQPEEPKEGEQPKTVLPIFPEAELRSLREEQKLIHKLTMDLAKMGGGPKLVQSNGNGETPAKTADLAKKTREDFRKMREVQQGPALTFTPQQKRAMEEAMEIPTIFEPEED
jgi:hypothetical protein